MDGLFGEITSDFTSLILLQKVQVSSLVCVYAGFRPISHKTLTETVHWTNKWCYYGCSLLVLQLTAYSPLRLQPIGPMALWSSVNGILYVNIYLWHISFMTNGYSGVQLGCFTVGPMGRRTMSCRANRVAIFAVDCRIRRLQDDSIVLKWGPTGYLKHLTWAHLAHRTSDKPNHLRGCKSKNDVLDTRINLKLKWKGHLAQTTKNLWTTGYSC